jgi:hypothetical protein
VSQVEILELSKLGEFDDGLLASAFNSALKAVTADLNDRPNDDRTREIVIKFHLKPIPRMGELDFVNISAVVTHKTPAQEGRTCTLSPKRIGKDVGLLFATQGPDIRQPGLFGGEEEES